MPKKYKQLKLPSVTTDSWMEKYKHCRVCGRFLSKSVRGTALSQRDQHQCSDYCTIRVWAANAAVNR